MKRKILPKKVAEKSPNKELISQLEGALEVSPTELDEIKAVCKKIGMSLEDYLLTIKRGLTATKTTYDKLGNVMGTDDDTNAQLKAALLGLEVEGYIRSKTSSTDNSKHTHVTYAWLTTSSGQVPVRDI